MREKELRIALVCFGGVSLAVYMHGISKEILKLVRASSLLHSIGDRTRRSKASFFDTKDSTDPEYDTEAIYFDVLREIGQTIELRVIVDIIAGASAGGINGAILARALSHDLPVGSLRDLWLKHADVKELLAPEARASTWSKWFLKPVVWLLGAAGGWTSGHDHEVRGKLSLFVRSRWFKPPLSGPRMAELMYDAMAAMGAPRHPLASLMPSGQRLDLFITVTDHYGYEQLVQIHQPPLIHEREHRHVLGFRYERRPNGEVRSDFDLPNVPALAFAARATSSFPGAFPPAQILEMDQVLAGRSAIWPRRADFIERNFQSYLRLNIDPASVYFVDGSVLNNRPFHQAISAIRGRPAYRQVDRRVVYIDPDPALPGSPTRHAPPGFFAVLKSALSDLPSIEPVTGELNWVESLNDRVDRLREIIEDARPRVRRLVANIVTVSLDQRLRPEQIRLWSEQANIQAVHDAGFAYEGYVRLKLASVRAFVSNLIASLHGSSPRSPEARCIAEVVNAWARATGRAYENGGDQSTPAEVTGGDRHSPRWTEFLLAFDVDYRKRRLHFMIEGQNRLYQMFDDRRFEGFDPAAVDRLKRNFYDCLDVLNRCEKVLVADPALREFVGTLFPTAFSPQDANNLPRFAQKFVEHHRERLDVLVDRLAAAINLKASTNDVELLLADTEPAQWHPEARRDVLVNYLGFPFWDVLTFPIMGWREVGEFNRILVDRISPQDAHTLASFKGAASLRGTAFGHFAAFFSRAYRENDYLMGRLHALDRLIDIVCDSAGLDPHDHQASILAWKKKGLLTILDAEEKHLPHATAHIAALRRSIMELGSGASG